MSAVGTRKLKCRKCGDEEVYDGEAKRIAERVVPCATLRLTARLVKSNGSTNSVAM